MPIFSHNFSGLFLSGNKRSAKSEPFVIDDLLGRFTLTDPKKKTSYCGDIELLGRSVTVFVETDGKEEKTAFASLNNLRAFAANASDWDARIKKFAADHFANKDGTIETWGGCDDREGETISKDEFMRRISMNFIQFYSDGSIFLDYSLDNMFTDHGLGVNADISGKIESCFLWG